MAAGRQVEEKQSKMIVGLLGPMMLCRTVVCRRCWEVCRLVQGRLEQRAQNP